MLDAESLLRTRHISVTTYRLAKNRSQVGIMRFDAVSAKTSCLGQLSDCDRRSDLLGILPHDGGRAAFVICDYPRRAIAIIWARTRPKFFASTCDGPSMKT